jgi:hypothetical protein
MKKKRLATSSLWRTEPASARAAVLPTARTTLQAPVKAKQTYVQSLFDHNKPSRHHRAVQGDDPISRQGAATAVA